MRYTFNATLKINARLDYISISCIPNATLDALDDMTLCYKFIAEIIFVSWYNKTLDTWEHSCLQPYCELNLSH